MTIIVYSKNNCVFCSKAKSLLTNLGLEYQEKSLEKDFGSDPSKLIEDIGKNVRTMPQIKIDGELIGGYNQLVEFFESLSQENLADIRKFFDSMPQLKHEVEVENPKTKVKSMVTFRGLSDFFSYASPTIT